MDGGKPSLGRVVLFRRQGYDEVPAMITRVWSDTCVNLMVMQDGGAPYAQTSVEFEREGASMSWRWPPRV